MKRRRAIVIKDPLLRKIRNGFRGLFRHWASDLGIAINLSESSNTIEATKRLEEISQVIRRSICYCRDCGRVDEDMVYVPEMKEWICVECDSKMSYFKKVKDEIRVIMSIDIINEFLDKLAGGEGIGISRHGSKCEGYTNSRLILSQMGISKEVQDKFLELCHYYGGHCDCEIILNASARLLNKEDY